MKRIFRYKSRSLAGKKLTSPGEYEKLKKLKKKNVTYKEKSLAIFQRIAICADKNL